MRSSEWVIAGYFTYLIIAAAAAALTARRRLQILSISTTALIGVGLTVSLSPAAISGVARDWAPGFYLLVGYWVPGLFYREPNPRLERWLARLDARLFALDPIAWIASSAPRFLLELLEFSYASCYVLVPGIFVILYFSGDAAISNRFWTAVLLSEFICYGFLPWLPSRPPRTLEGPSAIDDRRLVGRRLNLWVLGCASVQANTFPSGHVAGSLVAALIAWAANPILGVVTLLLALTITIATVIGRYHYAADAVAGAAVGAAVLAYFRA